eukprot:gene3510-6158_t
MNSLSEGDLSEKIKYPTIWLKTIDFLELSTSEFFLFLEDLIDLFNKENLVTERKVKSKSENCFLANDVIDNIQVWKQKTVNFSDTNSIILFFQFLIDLGAIENCANRRKPFNYSNSPFKFTLSFNNETMIKAYIIQIADNFEKYKIVRKLLVNPKNIFDFHQQALDSLDFQQIKQGFKTYKYGFQTTDLIIWIKIDKYPQLNTTYGAELLGECMRQLKLFSILKNGDCFENNISTTYSLKSKEEFEPIYSIIEESKDWKDCLRLNEKKKRRSTFFKSFEEEF